MRPTPLEMARHIAAVHLAEAEVRSRSDQAHQREFAATLRQWAEAAGARADTLETLTPKTGDQIDLFGEQAA